VYFIERMMRALTVLSYIVVSSQSTLVDPLNEDKSFLGSKAYGGKHKHSVISSTYPKLVAINRVIEYRKKQITIKKVSSLLLTGPSINLRGNFLSSLLVKLDIFNNNRARYRYYSTQFGNQGNPLNKGGD
jgi:hypothetical protein